MPLLRLLLRFVAGTLLLALLLLWPAAAALGVTVAMPLALQICLVLAGLGVVLLVVDMLRRGRGDVVWLSLLLAAIAGALPVTVFAFSSNGRFAIHLVAVLGLGLLTLIYMASGLRSGGLRLLAAVVVMASLLVSLPLSRSYIGSLAESQAERLEAQQRQLGYEEARRILTNRLREVDAPVTQTDIERRLDLQGLAQVRANALRERLRVVAQYEADYEVPVDQAFARGAAARFRDWRAPEGGDFRSRGPQQRDASRLEGEDSTAASLARAADETVGEGAEGSAPRIELPPQLYLRALRLGAGSESLAVAAAVAAMVLLLVHYLTQLQALFPRLAALPILGRWSDGIWKTERSVRLVVEEPALVALALREAVRKGEAALILGDVPLPASLPRLRIFGMNLPWPRLNVLREGDGKMQPDSAFCFEQVWFNRYACMVRSPDLCRAMLLDLVDIMRLRQRTKARAQHTVNLVWYAEEPPPEALVEELTYLAHVLNMRLIIAGPAYDDEADDAEGPYDSWYEE